MLMLSRIIYGMLFGILLILISEICLADQDIKPFIDDELMITHKVCPLYRMSEAFSLVGAYRHYEDVELSADRVFLGLMAQF